MKKFDVLSPELDIYCNYLIEASAGTGKTFAIENIFFRLLTEKEIPLEKILVVTFTKKAANELKIRIRRKLESSLSKGGSRVREIRRALALFDEANISTIHGFCLKELRENILESGLGIDFEDRNLTLLRIRSFVTTYLSQAMNRLSYSQAEIDILTREFWYDFERLREEIIDAITRGLEISFVPDFAESRKRFSDDIKKLREEGYTSQLIAEQFGKISSALKGVYLRDGGMNPTIKESLLLLMRLLDSDDPAAEHLEDLMRDGIAALKMIQPRNVKKKSSFSSVCSAAKALLRLRKTLLPYVSPNTVFAKVAGRCQRLLRKYAREEEFFDYDDILKRMEEACQNERFARAIREKYRAVLVDEFQDTDPLQWRIFEQLFPIHDRKWGRIYLVGDPKQAIYSFRSADIYTYLAAKHNICARFRRSLAVNYRSTNNLVDSLNFLFTIVPDLMLLPKMGQALNYCAVLSAAPVARRFSDNRGSVHFFVSEHEKSLEQAENKRFFPFIVQEIQRLREKEKLSLKSFAILVADRYQADRMAKFMSDRNIDSSLQKGQSLARGVARDALRDILLAMQNPQEEGLVTKALGGKIARLSLREIEEVDREGIREKLWMLRQVFLTKGFAVCFRRLLETSFAQNGQTVLEKILSCRYGALFLADLEKSALAAFDVFNQKSFRSILQRLDSFSFLSQEEDERVQKELDPAADAVQIMTTYAAKGLEFDVVFAVGLVRKMKINERLIPHERELVPVLDEENRAYRQYYMEAEAEKMRLLYVAWTRAKYRLYSPLLILSRDRDRLKSPMEIYLNRVCGGNLRGFLDNLEKSGRDIGYTLLDEEPAILTEINNGPKVSLIPPEKLVIRAKKRLLKSFSSLTHSHVSVKSLEVPTDFDAPEKNTHTLPAGSDTGILLHAILEKIDLCAISRAKSVSDIDIGSLVNVEKYRPWKEVLANMIFSAFKTPLFPGGFSLSAVDFRQTFREMEFVYGEGDDFVKGVMDFLFCLDGKYYIVDWKSNWLGPSNAFYEAKHMQETMADSEYFLQAEIYKKALLRFLKQRAIGAESFGGVYYLFLRGISEKGGIFKAC